LGDWGGNRYFGKKGLKTLKTGKEWGKDLGAGPKGIHCGVEKKGEATEGGGVETSKLTCREQGGKTDTEKRTFGKTGSERLEIARKNDPTACRLAMETKKRRKKGQEREQTWWKRKGIRTQYHRPEIKPRRGE